MVVEEQGTLLLIDDDLAARQGRAERLASEGWTVFEHGSGRGAADRVTTFRPDLVVCAARLAESLGFLPASVPLVAVADPRSDEALLARVRDLAFDLVVGDRSEGLITAIRRARRHGAVVRENERLAVELTRANHSLQDRLDELRRQTRRQAMVEDALTLARDHAMSASQAKSAFLTNMSHELRTPLNAMLGYAELMSETVDDPTLVADLGRIVFAGHHLLALIDDVLDLAKVEAGHTLLEIEDVDIEALVEAARLQALPGAEQRGLSFEVESIPGSFRGDRRLVLQCLHQLLDNAIAFTEHGSVALAVQRVDDELCFSVRDTGCGIPPREQAAIFGAFNREDRGGRPSGGPGLGLTITQRLCDLMGARLSLSSKVGSGSTFTVALPIRPEGGDEPG